MRMIKMSGGSCEMMIGDAGCGFLPLIRDIMTRKGGAWSFAFAKV